MPPMQCTVSARMVLLSQVRGETFLSSRSVPWAGISLPFRTKNTSSQFLPAFKRHRLKIASVQRSQGIQRKITLHVLIFPAKIDFSIASCIIKASEEVLYGQHIRVYLCGMRGKMFRTIERRRSMQRLRQGTLL